MQSIDFPFDKYSFKSDSILKDLPQESTLLLEKNMTTHTYKKGDILFREGSHPTGIYFIKKGKAKKFTTDKEGIEQIFYVCRSGELLGYHSLICGERYTDSAAALEESVISFVPKDDFLNVVQTCSVLAQRLLKCMSHEFGVLVNGLSIYARKTVRERLAVSLLLLRDKYKKDGQTGKPVELNLSREDLAKMVGTARETLTRLLNDFEKEDLIIKAGRKLILKNPLMLSKIANLY